MNKLALILATFFGAGLSPKAPGTAGSFATIPLAFLMAYFFGLNGIIIAACISFFLGVWATNKLTKNSDEKDPSKVVIDETAGQLMSFVLVADYLQHNLQPKVLLIYLLGFAFFRLFDIVKTGPVKWADTKIKNAWGVMLDDVFAGIFASIVLMLIVGRI